MSRFRVQGFGSELWGFEFSTRRALSLKLNFKEHFLNYAKPA